MRIKFFRAAERGIYFLNGELNDACTCSNAKSRLLARKNLDYGNLNLAREHNQSCLLQCLLIQSGGTWTTSTSSVKPKTLMSSLKSGQWLSFGLVSGGPRPNVSLIIIEIGVPQSFRLAGIGSESFACRVSPSREIGPPGALRWKRVFSAVVLLPVAIT